MPQELIVFVTCRAGTADQIAGPIVEEQLAACVNTISGITSTYRWEGKVARDSEDLLVIKCNSESWVALRDRIKQLHTYDTPEIICISIEDGYKPYLDWINSSLMQRK